MTTICWTRPLDVLSRYAATIAPWVAIASCVPLLVASPVSACSTPEEESSDGESYAINTPSETREAHRLAVRHLRAGEHREACDVLSEVVERRAVTEYLTVLCSTSLPEEALFADRAAEKASYPEVPPRLRDEHRDALDRHRAWIAGVQDALADLVENRLGLRRPLPAGLHNSKDLLLVAAWHERGRAFHAPTYERTRQAGLGESLEAAIAIGQLLAGIDYWNADGILFIDLSGLEPAPPPALVLPREDEL